MANSHQTLGQEVLEIAADKLLAGEGHGLTGAVVARVFKARAC